MRESSTRLIVSLLCARTLAVAGVTFTSDAKPWGYWPDLAHLPTMRAAPPEWCAVLRCGRLERFGRHI